MVAPAILLISTDLLDFFKISDRVLVMREGKLVAEIPARDATEERVLSHAIGAGTEPSPAPTEHDPL